MTRVLVLLVAVVSSLAGLPRPAAGQGLICDLLGVPRAREMIREISVGEGETYFISGPARFLCADGTTIQADSAVGNSRRGDLQLIRNVFYQDSVQTLTADWLNYVDGLGVVFARGNVVLTDRETRSVIRGDELEHRREREDRESFTIVQGGRPHATIQPRDSAPAGLAEAPFDERVEWMPDREPDPPPEMELEPDTSRLPLEVTADRLEITGERYFTAIGEAQLERGEMRGFGNEARFYQDDERLVLIGSARMFDDEIDLAAERIEARMAGDALTDVFAEEEAVLLAEDLHIEAPNLHILFDDGAVHDLHAWGDTVRIPPVPVAEDEAEETDPADVRQPDVDRPGAELPEAEVAELEPLDLERALAEARPVDVSRRARVVAQDIRVVADSVHSLAPGQQLERVIAVGQAFAERIPDGPLPTDVPDILARDWMRGDTIIGFFRPAAQAPDQPDAAEPAEPPFLAPETDSAGTDRARQIELERIVVTSLTEDALALYRRPPDDAQRDSESAEVAEATESAEARNNGRDGRSAMNFLMSPRITLYFDDSEVTTAEADGPLRGIYVDPVRQTLPDAGDAPPDGTDRPPDRRR